MIEEWELGSRASMQHDVVMHPDGRLYSVDMAQDQLYRLDPSAPDGDRKSWTLPRGDLPLGGVFVSAGGRPPANSNAHVGPHSIQVAADGTLWITLALGNQLAQFDPVTEQWQTVEIEHGYYPHTLRFDDRGAEPFGGDRQPANAHARRVGSASRGPTGRCRRWVRSCRSRRRTCRRSPGPSTAP